MHLYRIWSSTYPANIDTAGEYSRQWWRWWWAACKSTFLRNQVPWSFTPFLFLFYKPVCLLSLCERFHQTSLTLLVLLEEDWWANNLRTQVPGLLAQPRSLLLLSKTHLCGSRFLQMEWARGSLRSFHCFRSGWEWRGYRVFLVFSSIGNSLL